MLQYGIMNYSVFLRGKSKDKRVDEESQIDLKRQCRQGSVSMVCAGSLLFWGFLKVQFLHIFLLKALTVCRRRMETCL